MVKKITTTINHDEKHENKITKSYERFLNGIVSFFVNLLKLKDTGKYISLGVIIIVLYFFYKFLTIHGYSKDAMNLIIPYLGDLATLVFGAVAGMRGAQGIIEKITDFKALQKSLADKENEKSN